MLFQWYANKEFYLNTQYTAFLSFLEKSLAIRIFPCKLCVKSITRKKPDEVCIVLLKIKMILLNI
jgi:rubrerythrin